MRIGITGGIGSGKSYVCARLEALGIKVYDCDSAAKRIISSSDEIKERLTELIGPDTYKDGKLNKAAVASFLLASESNAQAIDAIVHPAVAVDFENSGIEWMECAILYESGLDRLVDKVIAVTAPDSVRVKRVMERDGITCGKVREWMARQLPQETVIARADYEIINDGTHDVDRQINELINKLK